MAGRLLTGQIVWPTWQGHDNGVGHMIATAQQFREWREKLGLTQVQVAERFGVTRTTVQNWESGATPISQSVANSCEIWGHRVRQIQRDLGPVTLIYADGPMYIDPYGPRGRPAMMQQEVFPTNAAALARVRELWGGAEFHNPLILVSHKECLWNVVELERVVSGQDAEAP